MKIQDEEKQIERDEAVFMYSNGGNMTNINKNKGRVIRHDYSDPLMNVTRPTFNQILNQR